MDSDWESTFEFVSETGQIKKRGSKTSELKQNETTDAVVVNNEKVKKRRNSKDSHIVLAKEIFAVAFFSLGMSCLLMADVSTFLWGINNPNSQQSKSIGSNIDQMSSEEFQQKVHDYMSEIQRTGRDKRPSRRFVDSARFYILSEIEPIELALRREWIPDHSFFEGVQEFIRGMEWENTFEEELFVRGVPNFDHDFESEEMTLKTTLDGKNYNNQFLNLGRKEIIGKHHSMEYFISGRTLIRLVKNEGQELSRTEYYLKHGDLHVYDKRGNLDCTRVYRSPTISPMLQSKIRQF